MKSFWVALAAALVILAWVLLGFGTVISIGYGLYVWAVTDVAFKLALWAAFVTWIKCIAGGVASLFAAFLITAFKG